jgi:hypothetical protein
VSDARSAGRDTLTPVAFTLDPDETLEQLRTVHSAFIDSSSVIYSVKAGVLEVLTRALELQTVAGVVKEVGGRLDGISVVADADPGLSVDDQLVAVAHHSGIPVISEDRKLLMKADDRDVDNYNVLVMLELMLLRGDVSLVEWDKARKRLLAAAHYSPWVVHAGGQLHWAVRKEIG